MYLTKKKMTPTSIIFMNVHSHYELLTCGQLNRLTLMLVIYKDQGPFGLINSNLSWVING